MNVWNKIIEFSTNKLNLSVTQKIIFGILGGIFIGLGFTAYYMITLKSTDPGLGLFFGSVIFSIGILLCVILGGSLITTNCLTLSCVLNKSKKFTSHILDLTIATFANWFGAALVGLIVFYSGILNTAALHDKFLSSVNAKNDLEWWKVFLTALLTNVLVAGGVIAYNTSENKTVGAVILVMCIATFVISGFNHIVANMYFSSISLLMTGRLNFLSLILLTFVGNIISGYALVFAYYFVSKSVKKANNSVTITDNKNIEQEKN